MINTHPTREELRHAIVRNTDNIVTFTGFRLQAHKIEEEVTIFFGTSGFSLSGILDLLDQVDTDEIEREIDDVENAINDLSNQVDSLRETVRRYG